MTGSIHSAAQAKPGSDSFGEILEAAYMKDGKSKVAELNTASYPGRASNGSSLLMSAPVGLAVTAVSLASVSMAEGEGSEYSAGCVFAGPASVSGGSGLLSGIRPA